MKNIRHLYIIGNGFDLYHGIRSSYVDFANWLKSNDSGLYQIVSRFYLSKSESFWNKFEESLGNISDSMIGNNIGNSPYVIECLDSSFPDILRTVIDDNRFITNKNCSPELGVFSDKLVNRIQSAFESWISDLTIPDIKKLKIETDDSYFINFNYTNTLESIYNIPKDQILYIHGNVSDKTPLIFGHGKSRNSIMDTVMSNKSDDIDFDYLKNLADSVFSLHKDVKGTINMNRKIWEKFSTVQDVHIWGHGLGVVDLPYFLEISFHLKPKTFCEISWHISENDDNGIAKSDDNLYKDAIIEKLSQIRKLEFLGFPNVDSKNLRSYALQHELNLFPKYHSIL